MSLNIARAIGSLLTRGGALATRWGVSLSDPRRSLEEAKLAPWLAIAGDKTLRLNYDLAESSVVLDVGGYEGQWTSDIFSRYLCTVHVFEPVPVFAEAIEARFARNRKIHVHRFGLGGSSRKSGMRIRADASSTVGSGPTPGVVQVEIRRATDFIEHAGFEKIDLMKVNIEGAEYELLEDLIGSGLIRRVENIQVQFHESLPDANERRAEIQAKLASSHKLTYCYPFVWENWRRAHL